MSFLSSLSSIRSNNNVKSSNVSGECVIYPIVKKDGGTSNNIKITTQMLTKMGLKHGNRIATFVAVDNPDLQEVFGITNSQTKFGKKVDSIVIFTKGVVSNVDIAYDKVKASMSDEAFKALTDAEKNVKIDVLLDGEARTNHMGDKIGTTGISSTNTLSYLVSDSNERKDYDVKIVYGVAVLNGAFILITDETPATFKADTYYSFKLSGKEILHTVVKSVHEVKEVSPLFILSQLETTGVSRTRTPSTTVKTSASKSTLDLTGLDDEDLVDDDNSLFGN